MPRLTITDAASRITLMAEKKHGKTWRPGGTPGKLHREMGIKEGTKIPAAKLEAATHSKDPEKRRDAIRAETMKGWRHGEAKPSRRATLYNKR